jgi:NADPH2:quinone reductase
MIADVPDPHAGPGQVVVNVGAAGVNFPDTLIIQNLYQFKPDLPFSPGGEVAGTVGQLGTGVDHVAVGDRVIAFPGWGGFAEQVVVEARTVIPIPETMPTDVAAAFVMTYGTSYHALKDRADPQPGETLLVLGAAGGVGLAAVELGKVMGLRVIAAASTDEKLAVCRDHGADEVINYSKEDLKVRAKELTGGAGADIVYDPVGGDYTEAALRATAWQGRLLVIGFAAGPIPKIPLNLTLLKGCDIRGVFWGSFAAREPKRNAQNLMELVAMFNEGTIRPHISARYPLEDTGAALRAVMDRMATGKIVIEL